ncbi:terminase TerL endonuclease subunit [Corynebacterium diphtheriae]|nr:terminase TerL endonuclease subunit [Corynebacterium diphtheriae]CAB0617057.1 hypothetical protein CIP107543_01957 [Corynebacterium diphtheriae]
MIKACIETLGEHFDIPEIVFDRWGAVQMSQNLEGLGFTVIPFGQGFKDMSPPSKELMKLALEGRLAHGGHRILLWMVDNIHVRTAPAGNIKPDKIKEHREDRWRGRHDHGARPCHPKRNRARERQCL